MSLLYYAGGCLVLAQLLGIYALVTRKADLIFAVVMLALLASAVVLGAIDVITAYNEHRVSIGTAARYAPVNFGSRRSKLALVPSAKSAV